MITFRNYTIVIALAALSIAWRDYNLNTFLAPGLEMITLVAVVSALLLPVVAAISIPLLTVALGDMLLGSHSYIFVFVWGAWALIAAMALFMRKASSAKSAAAHGAGIGVASSSAFFLITNFGTWFMGRGEWYADSLAGLMGAYAMGLPFYLTPLVANLVLCPVVALLVYRVKETAPKTAPEPVFTL